MNTKIQIRDTDKSHNQINDIAKRMQLYKYYNCTVRLYNNTNAKAVIFKADGLGDDGYHIVYIASNNMQLNGSRPNTTKYNNYKIKPKFKYTWSIANNGLVKFGKFIFNNSTLDMIYDIDMSINRPSMLKIGIYK